MNLNVLDFTTNTNNNHLQIQQQQQQQHIQQQLFNSNMQPQPHQHQQQQQQAQIVLVNQTGASNPASDMNADDFWYANLQLNNNHPNQFINIQQTQPHPMHQQQQQLLQQQQQQIHHIQPQQQQQHHIQLNELQLAANNMLIMMPPPQQQQQQQQNQPSASSSSSASSSAPASSSLPSSSMPQSTAPKNSSPTNGRKAGKPRKNQTSTPIKSSQLQPSASSSSQPSSSSSGGSSSNTVANLIHMSNQLNSAHSPAQSPSSVLLLSPSSSSSATTQQPVDPNAPKPPLTGYQHYFKLRQSELRSQDASLKFGDIVKIVGNEWSKNIDKETKDKFINRGLQDKERYKSDLKTYKQMNDGHNPPEMPHSEAAILPTTPNASTPQKGKPGKKSQSQQQQMQLQMQHALNGEIKMEVDSMVIRVFFLFSFFFFKFMSIDKFRFV